MSPPIDIDPTNLVTFLDSLRPLGLKHVSLSGGEPTLYPELAFLVRQLLYRGYYLSLTTNGASLARLTHLLDALAATPLSRVRVRLSVDGWKSLHDSIRGQGTFDAAVAGAAMIAAVCGDVSLNTVVFTPPIHIAQLVSEIPFRNIHDWALITPVERTVTTTSACVSDEILTNVDRWRTVLTELLPSTSIRVWDYLRHPNGGFIVEADGNVTMPGVHRTEDVVLGSMETVTPQIVLDHIRRRLNSDPVAFFTLST